MPRFPSSSSQKGLTLNEIAITLTVSGLLMGSVLAGQEMIASSRVRSLITQQDSIKTAYLGFLDRYRALPGDYGRASTNIKGVAAGADGNNNGQITAVGVAGATIDEHIAAWDHLSKAGFISDIYTYAAAPETEASAPINAYGRFLQLTYDNVYGTGTLSKRHNLKTGNQIHSIILAELDRKIDDGIATSGTFRFSAYNGGGTGDAAPTGAGACYTAPGLAVWSAAVQVANCGGARLF